MQRAAVAVVVAMAGLAVAPLATAAPAAAARRRHHAVRPHVYWHAKDAQVDAGTGPVFVYQLTHVNARERLYLERRVGSGRVWRVVHRLPIRGRHVYKAPAIPQGVAPYRMVVLDAHHHALAATKPSTVHAFADVPLGVLAQQGSQTVQVGGQLFSYVIEDTPPWHGETNQFLAQGTTTCRSLALQLAVPGLSGFTGGSVTVSVVQQSADPQSATVAAGATTSLDASLNGGPWTLEDAVASYASDSYGDASPIPVYLNGTASCWTRDGQVPHKG